MRAELVVLLNKMIRMIDLGLPIEHLGVKVTPQIKQAWERLGAEIAEIRLTGRAVEIPHDYQAFDFLWGVNNIPDSELQRNIVSDVKSSRRSKPLKIRKGSKCPTCKVANSSRSSTACLAASLWNRAGEVRLSSVDAASPKCFTGNAASSAATLNSSARIVRGGSAGIGHETKPEPPSGCSRLFL